MIERIYMDNITDKIRLTNQKIDFNTKELTKKDMATLIEKLKQAYRFKIKEKE